MNDVLHCKKSIEYLATKKSKFDICRLLLGRWHVVKELCAVLQVPYKATIALQNQSLTLSDTFGIWLRAKIFLEHSSMRAICKTDFAECILHAMEKRKSTILNNPAMLCAIYLDPRFRGEICRDSERTDEAIKMLANLSDRVRIIRQQTAEKQQNCSTASASSNISIEFNNYSILDEYLSNDVSYSRNTNRTDIEIEIAHFQPNKLKSNESILHFWESCKNEYPNLYHVANVVFGIPPTEVQIERDFSNLKFIFSERRRNLSEDMLQAILLIHLNKEIFFELKAEILKR